MWARGRREAILLGLGHVGEMTDFDGHGFGAEEMVADRWRAGRGAARLMIACVFVKVHPGVLTQRRDAIQGDRPGAKCARAREACSRGAGVYGTSRSDRTRRLGGGTLCRVCERTNPTMRRRRHVRSAKQLWSRAERGHGADTTYLRADSAPPAPRVPGEENPGSFVKFNLAGGRRRCRSRTTPRTPRLGKQKAPPWTFTRCASSDVSLG